MSRNRALVTISRYASSVRWQLSPHIGVQLIFASIRRRNGVSICRGVRRTCCSATVLVEAARRPRPDWGCRWPTICRGRWKGQEDYGGEVRGSVSRGATRGAVGGTNCDLGHRTELMARLACARTERTNAECDHETGDHMYVVPASTRRCVPGQRLRKHAAGQELKAQ